MPQQVENTEHIMTIDVSPDKNRDCEPINRGLATQSSLRSVFNFGYQKTESTALL